MKIKRLCLCKLVSPRNFGKCDISYLIIILLANVKSKRNFI